MLFSKRLTILALMGLIFSLCASLARAQDVQENIDILPAKSTKAQAIGLDLNTNTHPPVRLTPDKSELIRLDKAASTIIIGNPAHLSILAESSKTLVLVPRMPGATHFSILDKDLNVIMQRHAIVASPKKQYLRVRNSCAVTDSDSCMPTKVFYCPDMCHEIAMPDEESSEASAAASPAEAGGNAPQGSPSGDPAPDTE